ncbi:hypothetical protein Acr_14g0008130 [Actinidia rufa]|uniref:Retrotransposon gag domain-containing protein n=1 Tax=Actinidia rufa TaxID=165716 RepID=A0A7J0FTB8_9ERIC|nr:hypothetical protein Acr_14g0008130 [Actinidia rufa]
MAGRLSQVASRIMGGNGVACRYAASSLRLRSGMGLPSGKHIVPDKTRKTLKSQDYLSLSVHIPVNNELVRDNGTPFPEPCIDRIADTVGKGKGRLSHLLGAGPAADDPAFSTWDEEDSIIMSWLWDSMDPMISYTCLFFSTAKEIWEFIRRTYSKARDAAQVYEIKVKTTVTKQGDKSVTEYANLLQNRWQELDHYRVFEMKCPEDAAILKSFIEKDRVYDFLAGLNPEFDQARIQILGKKDTPSLEETISLIRAEESRMNVMLEPQIMDGSALATKTDHQEKGKIDLPKYSGRENQLKENKDNLWCTYCKKPRHTREKCWKLNGKPSSREWGNHWGQRPQAHLAEQPKLEENSAKGGFNSEEIEKLKKPLGIS